MPADSRLKPRMSVRYEGISESNVKPIQPYGEREREKERETERERQRERERERERKKE
jgi:hypothetical protein